jgi:acetyl esterase/lipase
MRSFLLCLRVGLLSASLVGAATRVHAQTAGPTRQMIQFGELTATPAPPADRREAYGPEPLQFGELRLPTGAGHRAVVVLLHGGCWSASYDLEHVAGAAAALAQAGYVVWVPEYRRMGDAGGGWPGTFIDVARAIDHLRDMATTVPAIDTTRVILVGHSAGGQLALWAASRGIGASAPELGVVNRVPLRVAGVVSLAGITDLAAYGAAAGGCNSAVTSLMGGTAAAVAERYHAVSPIEQLPLGAPVQLVHGAADPIVPLAQSQRYVDRARAAGGRATLTVVDGAGHFDLVAPQATAWMSVVRAVRAIAEPR